MTARGRSRIARLGDPDAPFLFKKGDRVAWVRFDGSADPDFVGEVVDGFCEYMPGGLIHTAVYCVKQDDGSHFVADHRNLIRRSPGQPKDRPAA